MMSKQKRRRSPSEISLFLIASLLGVFFTQSAHAEEKIPPVVLLGKGDGVAQLPASNSQSPIQVTGVRLNKTETGIEIILETKEGEKLKVTNRTEGNSVIAEIPNTVLVLPNNHTFQQEKPIAGITGITVNQVNSNTIRVTVTGEAGVPKIELFDSDEGLIFGLTPVASATPIPEAEVKPPQPSAQSDEPIELVVTGEQDGYRVPNATSATRTDTPLRDIPASIKVIPRQVLEDQQVVRLGEALQNVSGVTLNSSGEGFEQVGVRGFNNTPVLQDGFRQNSFLGIQTFPESANLERIEVLKGPASILYGQIQPGGVINTVAKKPLSTPFYAAELQIGSRDLFRPRIDFSGPVTSDGKLLYRLNALVSNDDGFRGFDTNFQRAFIAPTLTWKISDRTDLSIQLDYLNDKKPADFGRVASGNRVLRTPRDFITGEPGDLNENTVFNIGYNLEHRFSDNWKLQNAFRFTSRNLFQEFAFALSSLNEATNTLDRFYGGGDYNFQDYSLQTNIVGKFATGSVKHTLLFGVDLSRTDERYLQPLDLFTPLPLNIFNPVYGVVPRPNFRDLPVIYDSKINTDRLGIYLQDQIALVDNLKLLAGIRYETIKARTQVAPGFFGPGGDTTQNDDAFTPRLGLVYQPIPELSLYASYSRSFVPSTATTVNGDALKPEKGEGYEVGIKAELLKGSLFATLAYFDITKENVATADPNFPFASVATGEQNSRGVEFDVTGKILPGWNVLASYSYIDAKVTQDNTTPIGNLLPNTPKHSASLWTTYEIPNGDLRGLGLGVGFNYVGDRQGDLANSFKLDSYFLTNAAIFYRRNNWRFAVNFKNIFNTDYEPGAVGRTRIQVGDPFTVIGSISVEF